MAAITPSTIANRLGAVTSTPAATINTPPGNGGQLDIGADGTTATAASLCRIFDVTLTSGGANDTATFNVPAVMAKLAAPYNADTPVASAAAPNGLVVTVIPMNATAVTGAPFVTQGLTTPGTIVLTFAAAAAAAQYRICIDGRHSIGR